MSRPAIPQNFVVLSDVQLQTLANSLNNYIGHLDSVIRRIDGAHEMIQERQAVLRQLAAIRMLL
jgi:DNA-binding FrmR family transcriptional regulator